MIQKIEKIAKKYFENNEGVHDWTHIERVRNMALHIGRDEGADLEVLEIAALLHDIARCNEKDNRNKVCHAEESARMSVEILDKFDLSEEKKKNILHSIECHRYRNSHIPETLEAKCLYDADKLDAIGAVGIARDFLFAGHYTTSKLYTGREKELAESGNGHDYAYSEDDTGVLEWYVKLRYIKDKMTTESGGRIALERHRYMEEFFERFFKEVEGEL